MHAVMAIPKIFPPEILLVVEKSLTNATLATCLRVCKAWYQLFAPVLYRTIVYKAPLPSLEGMTRHVKHIRHLILDMNSDLETGNKKAAVKIFTSSSSLRCHNLTSLDLGFSGHYTSRARASCEALILLNQELRELTITDSARGLLRFSWTIVLSHCSLFLQTVDMWGCHLNKQETAALMELGSRLRQLELTHCRGVWSDFTAEPQFPEMRTLTIDGFFGRPAQELSWYAQCPQLQKISWMDEGRSSMQEDYPDEFRKISSDTRLAFKNLQSQTWRCLQRIELAYTFSDSQVAQILDSCGPLRVLSVTQAEFWYRSLAALERHSQTLEGLRLYDCDGLRSWMCQWIMVTFPKLAHLKLGLVFAHEMVTGLEAEEARRNQLVQDAKDDREKLQKEIMNGEYNMRDEVCSIMARFAASHNVQQARPWVCLNLVRLTIFIKFSAEQETTGWDQQIFRQISQLDRLEYLNLGQSVLINEHEQGDGLQMKMRSGLTLLAPLKKITTLKFVDTCQELDRQDLMWIFNQWPGLKVISSCLHGDKDKCDILWEMVKERGIKLLLRKYEFQDEDLEQEDDDEDHYSDFVDE